MSLALTLARPYARAAFALARQAGALPGWSAALSVSAQLAADPRIAALVAHPALERAEAAGLVAPPSCDAAFLQFLDVLAANDRLALLPEIAGQYEQLRSEAHASLGDLAHMLDETELIDLVEEAARDALRARYPSLGAATFAALLGTG